MAVKTEEGRNREKGERLKRGAVTQKGMGGGTGIFQTQLRASAILSSAKQLGDPGGCHFRGERAGVQGEGSRRHGGH